MLRKTSFQNQLKGDIKPTEKQKKYSKRITDPDEIWYQRE